MAPKPPDPIKLKFDAVKKTGEWNPTIGRETLVDCLAMFHRHSESKEIAGLFIWDEETDTISNFRMMAIDSNHGGGVQSDTGLCITGYLIDGLPTPNGQWHTHPGMTGFWSTTDYDDQMRDLLGGGKDNRVGIVDFVPNGKKAYIVCGERAWGMDWTCRLWTWENNELTGYVEGHPKLEGEEDFLLRQTPRVYTYNAIIVGGGSSWKKDDDGVPGVQQSLYGDLYSHGRYSTFGLGDDDWEDDEKFWNEWRKEQAGLRLGNMEEVIEGEIVEERDTPSIVDDIPPEWKLLAAFLDCDDIADLQYEMNLLSKEGQDAIRENLDHPEIWPLIFDTYRTNTSPLIGL